MTYVDWKMSDVWSAGWITSHWHAGWEISDFKIEIDADSGVINITANPKKSVEYITVDLTIDNFEDTSEI